MGGEERVWREKWSWWRVGKHRGKKWQREGRWIWVDGAESRGDGKGKALEFDGRVGVGTCKDRGSIRKRRQGRGPGEEGKGGVREDGRMVLVERVEAW